MPKLVVLFRPFPSYFLSLCQNESSCETMHFHANPTHFHHLNGFAQGLVLKMRQRATWKWPIGLNVLFIGICSIETFDVFQNWKNSNKFSS